MIENTHLTNTDKPLLGFPTANFPEEVIDGLPNELIGGIYWGYAQVQNGPVYGMVMSIGNVI